MAKGCTKPPRGNEKYGPAEVRGRFGALRPALQKPDRCHVEIFSGLGKSRLSAALLSVLSSRPSMRTQSAFQPPSKVTLLASALICVMLLSACGGGGGASNGSDSSTTAASQQPAVAPPTANASAPVAVAVDVPMPNISQTLDNGTALADPSSPASSAASVSAVSLPPVPTGASATFPSESTDDSALSAYAATAKIAAANAILSDAEAQAVEVRIYMDVAGNDSATGASNAVGAADGPVKTFGRAQQLVRAKLAAMSNGTLTRLPVRVLMGPGTYALSATQIFSSADSGTYAAPVSFEAATPGTVVISGGLALGTVTAPATATAVNFPAPSNVDLVAGASQLYVNGRRAILARQPNAGTAWFVQRPVVLPTDVAGAEGTAAFAPSAADMSWIAGLSAADKARAVVDVMHSWTNSRHHLAAVGTPAGAVQVAPRVIWPFLSYGPSQRYFIENVVAALDAPGEWIYDAGVVRYIRKADEASLPVTATLPLLEKLIVVQGESRTKLVQNLRFVGLAFAHTRYLTTAAGFTDHQSASSIGAAVEVNNATGVVFDNCRFSQTAGWGVWLRDSVRLSRITNTTFSDMGAGGVRVGLPAQAASDLNATGNNQVSGNTVTETGKLFPGAAAIWLGQTWDNQVQWNVVSKTTYSGISVGWTWGFGDAGSGRNLINGNLLYNIGQRQLADLGAIYTLGQSPGTKITNNVIREVRSYSGYGGSGFGIFNDAGSSGIIMETNVVIGSDGGGYFLQFGHDNVLHNNVFVAGDAGEISIGRVDGLTNLTAKSNLLVSKNVQPFGLLAQTPDVNYVGNEVSDTLSGTGTSIARCGSGCVLSKTSITALASPLAISSSSAIWTPVVNTAITSLSSTAAKTLALTLQPAVTTALPPVIGLELLPPAPVATGLEMSIDVAGTAPGGKPLGLVYELAGVTDAMKVISRADAPDGKCLAMFDGTSFPHAYEPMAFAKLNHTAGTTTVEFSLLIDANTLFWHEWRDDSVPYQGGPTFFVSPNGVEVNRKIVAAADVGQWTKFKITAPMNQPTAKWKLEMTRSNGQIITIDNLPMKTTNFTRLNWLGFISNGTTVATPCMTGIKASNS